MTIRKFFSSVAIAGLALIFTGTVDALYLLPEIKEIPVEELAKL